MKVRCKFVLAEIRNFAHGGGQQFVFHPNYDCSIPEDQVHAFSPVSGRFEMYVENPPVQTAFKIGEAYYFDITPAGLPKSDS